MTTNNKFIDVYDNLFEYREKELFFHFVSTSNFVTNGKDGLYDYEENQIFSSYGSSDLESMKFCDTNGFKFISEKYQLFNKKIGQVRVNCCNSFERSVAHTDAGGISLIYYVNMKWDIFWGGHTIFYNEDLSDVEYTCLFKPGRLIVFDGSIPHSISPISTACRENRYTFVIQYL